MSAEGVADEFRPYFDALARGILAFPRCGDCGRFHWYPMKLCPFCHRAGIGWVAVSGVASLFSWTIVRHDFDPAAIERYGLRAPYIVALLEFADAPGVRLISNLVEADPDALAIGMAVQALFPAHDGRVLFRPARVV